MLTINSEIIVFKDDKGITTPQGKKIIDYNSERIDAKKAYVTFKLKREQVFSKNERNQLIPEKPGLISLPPIYAYRDGADVYDIGYFRSIREAREGRGENLIIRDGQITLKIDSNHDYIYYLLKHPLYDSVYVAHNEKADADKLVAAKEVEATLQFYIYNKNQKLRKDSEFLRKIATAYGIKKAMDESYSDIELLELLEKAVMALENDKTTDKGVDSFVSDIISDPKELDIRQCVEVAMGQGLITWNAIKSMYFFNTDDGEVTKIVQVSKAEWGKKREKLIEFFLDNSFEGDTLIELVTGKIQGKSDHVPTLEEIETADWNELRKLVKNAGLYDKEDKKQDIVLKLKDHYGYLEEDK